MHINYLQVGSHIGNTDNDPVFNQIAPGMNMNIILIEPMVELFNKLVVNYSHKSHNNNIQFMNIAVSNHDGVLDLYKYPPPPPKLPWISAQKQPEWTDQLTSVNKEHLAMHGLANSPVNKVTVRCKTLNTIISENNITSIDNLFTDTEGHDYDILMDMDLSIVKPKNILFESIHTDGSQKKGANYTTLLNKFKTNGYTIVSENGADTLVSLL
jgi:FkbM family methyltransferase